jgi:signal transduction histidine kinase
MQNSTLSPNVNLKYWRIRLELFPVIAAVGVAVSVLSRYATFPDFQSLLAEAIMQLVGITLVYAFWISVSKALVYFDRERLSRLQIMCVGGAGGALMALSQSFLSWVFQVPLQTSFFMRAAGNVVVAAFWLPLQSVVVGNFRRYSKLKQEIRAEYLQLESVQFARKRALEEYRGKIEADIQDNLRVTTAEARSLFEALRTSSSHRLPEYLRVISEEYFRLTAHKLDSKIKERQSSWKNFKASFLEFRTAVHESVVTRPLKPTWFAIVIVVTVLVPLTAKADYFLIPEIMVATGISTLIVQSLLLRSFGYIEKRRVALTLLATAANVGFPILFARVMPHNDPKIGNHIGFFFVVIIVTCLGHIAQAGILKEGELRASLTKELDALKIAEKERNAEFSKITRDWAKYIHGTYTTKLEVAALAIESAITSDDSDSIERAITEVEQTLKLDGTRSFSDPQVLINEVRDRCSNWQELIDLSIRGEIRSDIAVAVSIKDVGDCVEEAVLNAVRHGDCSSIDIEICEKDTKISLLIKDNGVGFSKKVRGFGSSIYEEATAGDWELWRDEKNQATFLELNFEKA